MAAKKNKGKKKDVKKVAIKPGVENKTTLSNIIKDSEQAIVVSVTKGIIEITGIKGINYSYEAKGLLIGAMDTYNSRPVINGLNNNTRILMSHIMNLATKVNEISEVIVPKKKEGKKDELEKIV